MGANWVKLAGMFDSLMPTLVTLLVLVVGLLVCLLGLAIGVGRRLARMERQLGDLQERAESNAASSVSGTDAPAGGLFAMFLSEDPQRRSLPKAEQFAAYRRWRQENGLNWNPS